MPDRIQLSRKKGWRKPDGAITVARPTIWGNPWQPNGERWGALLNLPGVRYRTLIQMDRLDTVLTFQDWLANNRIIGPALPDPSIFHDNGAALRAQLAARRQAILDSLPSLRGHALACWCPLGCDCHADVLLEMANG